MVVAVVAFATIEIPLAAVNKPPVVTAVAVVEVPLIVIVPAEVTVEDTPLRRTPCPVVSEVPIIVVGPALEINAKPVFCTP